MLDGFIKIPISRGRSNPALSITNNGFIFNSHVVTRMQRASYINILINKDKKQIAIQACDDFLNDKFSFFRSEKNLLYGVHFSNRNLQLMISNMMHWDLDNFNYRANGFYIENENAMIFDLNNSRKFIKRLKKVTY